MKNWQIKIENQYDGHHNTNDDIGQHDVAIGWLVLVQSVAFVFDKSCYFMFFECTQTADEKCIASTQDRKYEYTHNDAPGFTNTEQLEALQWRGNNHIPFLFFKKSNY